MRKVLVITPHPDDAEFFAGGTLAKMAREGAAITILIATSGEKGSFEIDALRLKETRRLEALRAAAVLGVQEVSFLGHPDGELDRLPPGHLRAQFIRAIRERKPDILFTFDPFAPFEDHPDHRAVAFAALEAANFAPYPLYHPEQLEEGLSPHYVIERYFFSKDNSLANKAVDIEETLEVKIAALLEHRSQLAFLFEDWMHQAELAGEGIEAMLSVGGESGESEDWARGMALVVRQRARADGIATGLRFAERFRYSNPAAQRPAVKRWK